MRSILSPAREQWRSNTLLSTTRSGLSRMLIALGAMFLQQMFASVGKVLPAVLAPLIITELHADPLGWRLLRRLRRCLAGRAKWVAAVS
jgi:hypothetical protein